MQNGKRKILYIHDKAGDPGLIRMLCEQDDRLELAGSPASGLDFDRLRSGEFDACLLDLDHMETPGGAILAAIREQAGNVPAVILANGRLTTEGLEALHLDIRDGLVRDRGDASLVLRALHGAIEQRKAERALRESEARYRQLLETVSDYVYMVRIDNGRPAASWHSPTCIAVTGYASGEYAADPFLWFRMVHDDDRQAVVEMTSRVLAGETPPPLEHRILHKDGSIRWIRNTPIPCRDPEGRLIACEGIVADISVRKRAEQELLKVNTALRESEERLKQELEQRTRAKREWEATFDAIANPLFIHDHEFRIRRANRAYCEASGMTFQEMIGRPYYEVFPKLGAPLVSCARATTLNTPSSPAPPEELAVPDLRKVFRARSFPVHDEGGRYLFSVHILEDITEMKLAEEHIRQEMEITANLLAIAETTADTMDIDKLLVHVTRCGSRVLGSDACVSYLWDRDRKTFVPAQQHGLEHELIPLFRTEALGESVEFIKLMLDGRGPFQAQTPAPGAGDGAWLAAPFMNSGSAAPLLTKTALWMTGGPAMFVAIPLSGKTDRLGLLIALYRNARSFTERDRQIVEGLSRQASLALDEAHLYRTAMERSLELNHKIETLQVIHEIDRSILSSLEPQEILETTTRNISRVVPCDRAGIMLADRRRQGFIQATGNGKPYPAQKPLVPFQDTSATEVIKTARPQYAGNMKGCAGILPKEQRLVEEGFVSHIRVPLVVKGEPIGVLSVDSRRTAAFTPENLSTLEKIAALIGVALENTRLVTDLKDLLLGTVKSLSNAIDAKSPWTAGHSERVTRYALLIGRGMSFPESELKDLELGGLLHDVGKIGIYDAILNKPASLSREEFEIVRKHPLRGVGLLEPIRQLDRLIPCIRHHHERYDGTGYPDGLKGDAIHLWARILAIADAFDSMTADRPYRKAFKREQALEEIRRCSAAQFDPAIVNVFLDVV